MTERALETPTARAEAAFRAWRGAPSTVAATAPGRVNLIGEHTDYNDGFVLPCPLSCHTAAVGVPRPGSSWVRVRAAGRPGTEDAFDLAAPLAPLPREAPHAWANYVRGVAAALLRRGQQLRGVDLCVAGDVPEGAGLSSSASLEVAVGDLFCSAYGLAVSATELALAGQEAEHRFAGVRCGIMDQLVAAVGRRGEALLIDCRSLATEAIPLPRGVAVVVVHSRVRRGLVESEYNARRAQCEAAARHFGVAALRDVDRAQLEAREAELEPVVARRARHVIEENARTLEAAEALRRGDLARLGALMAASHASLRDLFEVSHPSVDHLVELLQESVGPHGGARMTGGGFGGCCVALAPKSRVGAIRNAIAERYRSPDGESATVWVHDSSEYGARHDPPDTAATWPGPLG